MVKYYDAMLDRTFAALADPTRRALLARLNSGKRASVSELARPFPMSLPAVMKHLDVLSHPGLIRLTQTGPILAWQPTPEPEQNAMNWPTRYQQFWSEQLDRLASFLEREPCPPKQKSPSSQASPSNVVSMRPPKRSTPRGRTRKN